LQIVKVGEPSLFARLVKVMLKHIRHLVWAVIMSGGLTWSGAHADTNTSLEAANKKLVVDYFAELDRLETLDPRDVMKQAPQAIHKYVRPDYIQHSESFERFGQGSAGLIRLLESRLNASDSSEPKLGALHVLAVMARGDLVVRVNSRELLDTSRPPLIIFNLFRIQDDLIAEHWDAMSSGLMPRR
jgi:predicted SnoaL-like aldol condensation-catalyzing enzyme